MVAVAEPATAHAAASGAGADGSATTNSCSGRRTVNTGHDAVRTTRSSQVSSQLLSDQWLDVGAWFVDAERVGCHQRSRRGEGSRPGARPQATPPLDCRRRQSDLSGTGRC